MTKASGKLRVFTMTERDLRPLTRWEKLSRDRLDPEGDTAHFASPSLVIRGLRLTNRVARP